MRGVASEAEAEHRSSTPQANGQEIDVNDHFASIIHEERMREFRRDADASGRVAEARRGRVARRSTLVGLGALAAILAALALSGMLLVPSSAQAGGVGTTAALADVRASTARFQRLEAARAAGYTPLHVCTDHEGGMGAMGQHYVRGDLVGDTLFDPSQPEVLVYEPVPNGRMRLVAVEFIVFADAWAGVSSSPPSLFGQELSLVPSPNRYDVPAFYQVHVWLWRNNPSGTFSDWNPRVSCHGMGDPA